MRPILTFRSTARTTVMVILAYVLVLQSVLTFAAAAEHITVTSAPLNAGIICPAHVEEATLHPDQPVHTEHGDFCCITQCGFANTLELLTDMGFSTVQYTQSIASIRAPPDIVARLAPNSSPVAPRAPPSLG